MTSHNSQIARVIATLGGLGNRLPAPGTTVGSLPAFLLWWAACAAMPSATARIVVTAVGLFVAAAVGAWASEVESSRCGETDPREIVVDEVAGQWLTYLVALPFVTPSTSTQLALFGAVGFLSSVSTTSPSRGRFGALKNCPAVSESSPTTWRPATLPPPPSPSAGEFSANVSRSTVLTS